MKRIICLALAFMLLLAPVVRADIIFEPWGDKFYETHKDECRLHERSYLAQGPDGSVVVYDSPESAAQEVKLENGTILWISWVYEGETRWGYCEDFVEEWSGWVPMDYLLLRYDHICFTEEFGSRIEKQEGTVDAAGQTVRFWDYPGSPDASASLRVDGDYLPEYYQFFTDDAGRNWGCISYFKGIRNVWVCLDDPDADYETLYAEHPPQQVTHPTMNGTVIPGIKPEGPGMDTVILAAAAVAAISAAFLWLTRKKK